MKSNNNQVVTLDLSSNNLEFLYFDYNILRNLILSKNTIKNINKSEKLILDSLSLDNNSITVLTKSFFEKHVTTFLNLKVATNR